MAAFDLQLRYLGDVSTTSRGGHFVFNDETQFYLIEDKNECKTQLRYATVQQRNIKINDGEM